MPGLQGLEMEPRALCARAPGPISFCLGENGSVVRAGLNASPTASLSQMLDSQACTTLPAPDSPFQIPAKQFDTIATGLTMVK